MRNWTKHLGWEHAVGFLIAVGVVYVLSLVSDRTPPFVLYDGRIAPNILRVGDHATITWRATYRGSDCPGNTQRETVSDVDHGLTPELARRRAGVFHPDPGDPYHGTFTTPDYVVPILQPGGARYRVTLFFYCNSLQKWLGWPIIRESPWIVYEVAK